MPIRKVLIAPLLMGLLAPVVGQTQSAGQVVTRTRLVTYFSQRETEWLDALKKKDSAALDKILADDFQVWVPERSAPIPREEWQSQALNENLQSYRFRDVSVRAVTEDVAIESLLLEETVAGSPSSIKRQSFVVNVWLKDGDSWHCTDSYRSPVTTAPSGPPKPDGKH